jgi:hypothetical protein
MAPSHASAPREGGGEALTGGVQARLLSSEINRFGLPTLFTHVGRLHEVSRKRERRSGPAESGNQGMYASFLHGNREIPEAIDRIPQSVRSEKA